MVISCPICHNEITFASKGKTEKDVILLFDVNKILLNQIYDNVEFRNYAQHENE
jgi:hypothetical protein